EAEARDRRQRSTEQRRAEVADRCAQVDSIEDVLRVDGEGQGDASLGAIAPRSEVAAPARAAGRTASETSAGRTPRAICAAAATPFTPVVSARTAAALRPVPTVRGLGLRPLAPGDGLAQPQVHHQERRSASQVA